MTVTAWMLESEGSSEPGLVSWERVRPDLVERT
jgi:hypothetical protein